MLYVLKPNVIQNFLDSTNMSKTRLSTISKVSPATINEILLTNKPITLNTLYRLASTMEASWGDLVDTTIGR